MAKKEIGQIKLQIPGGDAKPAPPVGPALGQLGVFYLLKGRHVSLESAVRPDSIFFASCDEVKCRRICKPGDILTLQIRPRNIRHPLALFQGGITVDGEKTAVAEEIKLAFDYERVELPESVNAPSNGNLHAPAKAEDKTALGGRLGNPEKV